MKNEQATKFKPAIVKAAINVLRKNYAELLRLREEVRSRENTVVNARQHFDIDSGANGRRSG